MSTPYGRQSKGISVLEKFVDVCDWRGLSAKQYGVRSEQHDREGAIRIGAPLHDPILHLVFASFTSQTECGHP